MTANARTFCGATSTAAVVNPSTGVFMPGDLGTVWSSNLGGTQYQVMTDENGANIANGVIQALTPGYCQQFTIDQSPPVESVWLDFGGDTRVRVECNDRPTYRLDSSMLGVANGVASLDATGKLKQHIDVGNVDNLTFPTTPYRWNTYNLVTNPGMESGLTPHWTSSTVTPASTGVAHSGASGYHVTVATANPGYFFNANGNPTDPTIHPRVAVGESYHGEVWVRTGTSGTTPMQTVQLSLKIRDATGTVLKEVRSAATVVTPTYVLLAADITVTDLTSNYITIGLNADTEVVNASVRFDDLALRLNLASSTSDAVSQADFDALNADYQSYKDTSASIEELTGGWIVPGRFSGSPHVWDEFVDQGRSFNQTIWIAPFACQLLTMDLVREYGTSSLDNTNYIRVQINKSIGASYYLIGQKTTQSTGGEAMTQKIPWSFDGVTFDPVNSVFAKGDSLSINFASFGTGSLQFPVCGTFRYMPL